MKLLTFSLKLRASGNKAYAAHELPFLGGMLHGAWEHQIRTHFPESVLALGLNNEAGMAKRYAILPPPFGFKPPELDEGVVHLGFGVMLYGEAGAHAKELVSAFSQCRSLSLGVLKDTVEQVDATEHIPVVEQDFLPRDGIQLQWITPLLLDSQGQRLAGRNQDPPALLRIVRSISKKMRTLEPEMADKLGLNTAEWLASEETIRSLSIHAKNWRRVTWRYGSRTKESPIQLNGQMGEINYLGPICSSIHRLLHWGTWFGAGQRTALGQGFYRIEDAV